MARFIASPCNILKVYINIDVYNMRRTIKVGLIQQSCTGNTAENMDKLKHSIEDVASKGAELVVLQELHNTLYFCQTENTSLFDLAETIPGPSTEFYSGIASANGIVLVTSLFEKRAPGLYHNTAVVFDKDGSIAGKYRKMHIPDDPAYYEKFYFTPGDTGFKVFETRFGTIGVGICWDQWFPETARCMAVQGAEILLYPTAIGSEPILNVDSSGHWRRVMQGHAAANLVPVAAANRIGTEIVTPCEENGGQSSSLTFYGSSFIADATGELVASAGRDTEEILYAFFDLDALREERFSWGLFRDRRPETYRIMTKQ